MALLQFFKYQGTGNDFIMIDNRDGNIQLTTEQVQQLCNRKFGVGSDGLVLIESTSEADFHMNFFNPDGSKSFCGNGSRCAVRFAQQLGVVGQEGRFLAIDGLHDFSSDEGTVHIHMRDVESVQSNDDHYVINTGSPHYIMYVNDLEHLDVVTQGRSIRYNDTFKAEGINVNFVEENEHGLSIRTYERGR
jgi:diaminopimelate epimerase